MRATSLVLSGALLFGVLGCGGGANPLDMAGLADLAGGSFDLATSGGGDLAHGGGDLAGCSEPTSGFYVLSHGSLLLISPDPNSWDSGKYISLVDGNGNPVIVDHMTVQGGFLYFNAPAGIYTAAISSIQNGKLMLSPVSPITFSPPEAGEYFGVLCPNANGSGAGDLVMEFSSISARVGALEPSSNSFLLTPASAELQLSCKFVDFEGQASGDTYDLTVACGTDLITVHDGMMTGTVASGQAILAGIQVYQGKTYVMDNAGNLYDGGLNLIKKTRLCQPGSPGSVQSVSVDSM